MNVQKTMVEADRVPVAVPLTAVPGDHLIVVGGVCIAVERGGLGEAGIQPSFAISNKRTRREGAAHAKHLRDDLLLTLYDLREPTPTKRVLDKIEPRIASKLQAEDYERQKSGDVRWRNKVQWARFLAVNEGLMKKDAERGMWELSDLGRRRAEEIRRSMSSGGQ